MSESKSGLKEKVEYFRKLAVAVDDFLWQVSDLYAEPEIDRDDLSRMIDRLRAAREGKVE